MSFTENPVVLGIVSATYAAGTNDPASFTLGRVPVAGELILLVATNANSITCTTPTGFTLIQLIASGAYRSYIWYKIAGASETGTYSVDYSNSSDFRELFGIIISTYNPSSILGTSQSKIETSAVSTPQNILSSAVTISNGSLVIFNCKLLGNQRDNNALTQNFSVGNTEPSSNAKSYIGYKSFVTDDASVNPSWSWTGGTTAFLVNWIVINPTI